MTACSSVYQFSQSVQSISTTVGRPYSCQMKGRPLLDGRHCKPFLLLLKNIPRCSRIACWWVLMTDTIIYCLFRHRLTWSHLNGSDTHSHSPIARNNEHAQFSLSIFTWSHFEAPNLTIVLVRRVVKKGQQILTIVHWFCLVSILPLAAWLRSHVQRPWCVDDQASAEIRQLVISVIYT